MKRIATLAAITLITLTGCSANHPAASTPTPDPSCLTLSEGSQSSLQHGLDQAIPGQTIEQVYAYKSNDSDGWFIAAQVNSEGDDVTATWYTAYDPTAPGENAYSSVDAMAEAISHYLRPVNASPTMPGAEAAHNCLT